MASDQVKRKLAAILAADVAGYSRLMGADEVRYEEHAQRLSPMEVSVGQAPCLTAGRRISTELSRHCDWPACLNDRAVGDQHGPKPQALR